MAGYHLVDRVDDARGAERPEEAREGSGERNLFEERHAASRIALNRRAVAPHEPPAFIARVLRYRAEQASRLLIVEPQQRQLFASIELDDDTRRPPAELSGAGIDENRPGKR